MIHDNALRKFTLITYFSRFSYSVGSHRKKIQRAP